jgi:hypothetical protein
MLKSTMKAHWYHIFLILLAALQGTEIMLMVVGGFGLTLRSKWLLASQQATIMTRQLVPRSTEDIDLMLPLELLADRNKMQSLRVAILAMGFEELVPRFQFVKPASATGIGRNVKIDLLAPQPTIPHPILKVTVPRIGHKNNSPLHGRVTPEALAIEQAALRFGVIGKTSDGQQQQAMIELPNAFSLLLMKLFAYRDNEIGLKGPASQPNAERHAADIYRIVALLTEEEFEQTLPVISEQYQSHPIVIEAQSIVKDYLSQLDQPGIEKITGQLRVSVAEIETFYAVMRKLFELEG